MEAELHVVVLVEVADHVHDVLAFELSVAVLTKIPTYHLAGERARALSVDPLEGCVRFKLRN